MVAMLFPYTPSFLHEQILQINSLPNELCQVILIDGLHLNWNRELIQLN